MRLAIVAGSVFGTAEEVAFHANEVLVAQGLDATYQKHWNYDALLRLDPQALLFITSTTGMGELPQNLQPLVTELENKLPDWAGRPVGIIALGDSCYGESFCAGGEQVRELTQLLALVELQDMLRLDASETVTPAQDAEPWLLQWIQALKTWASV